MPCDIFSLHTVLLFIIFYASSIRLNCGLMAIPIKTIHWFNVHTIYKCILICFWMANVTTWHIKTLSNEKSPFPISIEVFNSNLNANVMRVQKKGVDGRWCVCVYALSKSILSTRTYVYITVDPRKLNYKNHFHVYPNIFLVVFLFNLATGKFARKYKLRWHVTFIHWSGLVHFSLFHFSEKRKPNGKISIYSLFLYVKTRR